MDGMDKMDAVDKMDKAGIIGDRRHYEWRDVKTNTAARGLSKAQKFSGGAACL